MKMIEKFRKKLGIHTLEVLKKSSASMVVKVIGMTFGLIISIFLGRTIGSDGLGIINLSTRIISLLIAVALLGLAPVISKEVAIAINNNKISHISDIMFTSSYLCGAFSLTISIFIILISSWLANNIFNEPRLTYPLIIGITVMTPQVFSRIFSAGLVGYKKIWQSNLVDQALSMGVTGVLLLFILLLKIEVTIILIAILYAIGRIMVTITIGLYWRFINNHNSVKLLIPRELLEVSLPILVANVNGLIISGSSLIFLGWLVSSSEVGLYAVAERLALLTGFFLQVTNSILMPKIAALFAEKSMELLEEMLQDVVKGLMVIGSVIFTFFVFFGEMILKFWGNEFQSAYSILLILAFGQLVNLVTGPVGIILIMSGHEKVQARISLVFMPLFIALNYTLISFYGLLGAAIASSTVIIAINVVRSIFVKRKIGLNIYF